MSRIEDVARLKDALAGSTFSSEHTECRDMVDTLNAAPWLLAVAGQFRSGDADRLYAIRSIMSPDFPADELDCMDRMIAAARIMEGQG